MVVMIEDRPLGRLGGNEFTDIFSASRLETVISYGVVFFDMSGSRESLSANEGVLWDIIVLSGDVDVYVVGVRSMIGVSRDKGVLVVAEVRDFRSTGVEDVIYPGLFGKVGDGLGNFSVGVGECLKC